MVFLLGKTKPTRLEEALLRKAGLGNIKGNFITGYYLEPLSTEFQIKGNVVVIKGTEVPLIRQDKSVKGFSLDIEGIGKKIEPDWNSEDKINARKERYKEFYINSRVEIYKKIEGLIKNYRDARNECNAADEIGGVPERAYARLRLEAAAIPIYKEADTNPTIFSHFSKSTSYDYLNKTDFFDFVNIKIDETTIRKIETEKFENEVDDKNAYDPKTLVPDSIKNIIINSIEIRMAEIKSNIGIFKRMDISNQKFTALGDLITEINKPYYSSSDLEKLIANWETKYANTIDEARSRISIFETTTATRTMLENIKKTLSSDEKQTDNNNPSLK